MLTLFVRSGRATCTTKVQDVQSSGERSKIYKEPTSAVFFWCVKMEICEIIAFDYRLAEKLHKCDYEECTKSFDKRDSQMRKKPLLIFVIYSEKIRSCTPLSDFNERRFQCLENGCGKRSIQVPRKELRHTA